MSNENRKRKIPSGFILLLFIVTAGYIHGMRLADISEMGSSQRPWSVVITGTM